MPCCGGSSYQKFKEKLAEDHKELGDLVLENFSADEILVLYEKKTGKQVFNKKIEVAPCNLPLEKSYLNYNTRDLAKDFVRSISDQEGDRRKEILRAAGVCAKAICADCFSVYIPIQNDTEVALYQDGELIIVGAVGKGRTVVAHAIDMKTTLLVENLKQDARFPRGIHPTEISDCSVICIPIILPSDDIAAVIELVRVRSINKPPLSEVDLQFANAIVGWMAACIHENDIKRVLNTQQALNDFLLGTTKDMFDEMTNVDKVVQKIIMFTKNLVKADRCSMFLVDEERKELYADYFDVGNTDTNGQPIFEKRSQIRFHTSKGIAGYVATTGKIVNIYNAYADERFNPDIDKATGYHTRNILCMPIFSKNKVIGVVQMINSLSGDHFTHADETAFNMFAVYCALAIQYSIVYKMLKRQQNQYKVAVEILQYHINCQEDELEALMKKPHLAEKHIPPSLHVYDFVAYPHEYILPQLVISLIEEMFGTEQFELQKLCCFILTVRRNYRPVAYHNWTHGFHVMHALWCMIETSPNIFTNFEKMALLIAGICHDVDHRGYNNAFFTKLNLPLANLYSTSVMEQHHYKQTVTILQQEGADIFSFLTPEEYRDILKLIRHHIIATDLALYFNTQKLLASALDKGEFTLANQDLKMETQALMMTGADLCAIAKPWESQQLTAKYIYEEFYMQGDEEKKQGMKPLPMMDRENEREIPQQQIGFISFICVPLYETLEKCLPSTAPLLTGCKRNKEMWTNLARKLEEEQSS